MIPRWLKSPLVGSQEVSPSLGQPSPPQKKRPNNWVDVRMLKYVV